MTFKTMITMWVIIMSTRIIIARTQFNQPIQMPKLLRNPWSASMICILCGIIIWIPWLSTTSLVSTKIISHFIITTITTITAIIIIAIIIAIIASLSSSSSPLSLPLRHYNKYFHPTNLSPLVVISVVLPPEFTHSIYHHRKYGSDQLDCNNYQCRVGMSSFLLAAAYCNAQTIVYATFSLELIAQFCMNQQSYASLSFIIWWRTCLD